MKTSLLALALFLPLLISVPACAQVPQGNPELRVASYNIEWLSDTERPERLEKLEKIIRDIDADVIGFQEIKNKKALEQFLPNVYEIWTDENAREYQQLAIAVKRPYKLVEAKQIFTSPTLEYAFPRFRDVIEATVEAPTGEQFNVYVVHLKSRSGGRANTDGQRMMAMALLTSYLTFHEQQDFIVLGDFNDAPDDPGPNILKTGMIKKQFGEIQSTFAHNLMDDLYKQNYVSYGMNYLYSGQRIRAIVDGAYAENVKWRDQNPAFPGDFAVTQILFDHIVISKSFYDTGHRTAGVYDDPIAMSGRGGRIQFRGDIVEYTEFGDLASDHLPVWADLRIPLGD